MSNENTFYDLNAQDVDPARIKRERETAKALRKTSWWHRKIQMGVCHYCGETFPPSQLTMDHVVPLARGGTSVKGNCVPSCDACNKSKGLDTPVDRLLK